MVSTYGLGSTLAKILLRVVHFDPSVAMPSGRPDALSVKIYKHLHEREGQKLQKDLIGDDINRMACEKLKVDFAEHDDKKEYLFVQFQGCEQCDIYW